MTLYFPIGKYKISLLIFLTSNSLKGEIIKKNFTLTLIKFFPIDFVFPTNAPVEVRNQIYSEDVVNYPTDLIKQMNFDSFKSFFVNFDYVETSLLDIRKENELTSEEFCNSISRKIRPREGVNKDNAKRLIINYEELKQEFSIEECS